MVDYSELKKLAESLNRAIEQAEHKPGQWAGTAQSVGGICCAGEPFQIGKPWAKEEPWAHFSYKRDSWLAVAAVNALPQLMALIAENERVKARLCVCRDCGGQGEAYSGHSSYQGYNQPPEPDMDVCGTCGGDGVLGPLEDFESLAAERDQLKAEIAGLKTGYEAYEQVVQGLRAEVEALREANDKFSRRNGMLEESVQAMTETHVLYTWLRKKVDQPSNDFVAVQMNIGHDWAPVHDLDRDLRSMIEREEP